MRMTAISVLWRTAAGPRIGYGHLVRSVSLARALGVPAIVSLRARSAAHTAARRLGARLASARTADAIAAVRPDLIVLDDPSPRAAAAALAAARRARVPVVSIHDLGLGWVASDLLVDGSIVRPARALRARRQLVGSRFAVLNLSTTGGTRQVRSDEARRHHEGPRWAAPPTVLVTLGGGPRVRLARAIAARIVAGHPSVHVRIAGGFSARGRPAGPRVTWLPSLPSLEGELACCDVAVVAGGVSAYEACALGTAAIAISVVPPQRVTVEGLARAGAVVDAGHAASGSTTGVASEAAERALALLGDARARTALARTARRLVDGRGAERVAAAIRMLAGRRPSNTRHRISAAA